MVKFQVESWNIDISELCDFFLTVQTSPLCDVSFWLEVENPC